MNIATESEMLKFGEKIAKNLTLPAVIELIGDVGAGKTTFTRGLARGLGISEPVTSPSFTISKRYAFPLDEKPGTCCCNFYNTPNDTPNNTPAPNATGILIHYDFYRLDDPGIMRDELAESLENPSSVVVIEWGGDVASLLPENRLRLEFKLLDDDSREVTLSGPRP